MRPIVARLEIPFDDEKPKMLDHAGLIGVAQLVSDEDDPHAVKLSPRERRVVGERDQLCVVPGDFLVAEHWRIAQFLQITRAPVNGKRSCVRSFLMGQNRGQNKRFSGVHAATIGARQVWLKRAPLAKNRRHNLQIRNCEDLPMAHA